MKEYCEDIEIYVRVLNAFGDLSGHLENENLSQMKVHPLSHIMKELNPIRYIIFIRRTSILAIETIL